MRRRIQINPLIRKYGLELCDEYPTDDTERVFDSTLLRELSGLVDVLVAGDKIQFSGYLPYGKLARGEWKALRDATEEISGRVEADLRALAKVLGLAFEECDMGEARPHALRLSRRGPRRRRGALLFGKGWSTENGQRHEVLWMYLSHELLGFVGIEIQVGFPWRIRIWVNGHEIVQRLLDAEGIRYRAYGNKFTWIEAPGQAQRLADEIAAWPARHWNRILGGLVRFDRLLLEDGEMVVPSAKWLRERRQRLATLPPSPPLPHPLARVLGERLETPFGRRTLPGYYRFRCFSSELSLDLLWHSQAAFEALSPWLRMAIDRLEITRGGRKSGRAAGDVSRRKTEPNCVASYVASEPPSLERPVYRLLEARVMQAQEIRLRQHQDTGGFIPLRLGLQDLPQRFQVSRDLMQRLLDELAAELELIPGLPWDAVPDVPDEILIAIHDAYVRDRWHGVRRSTVLDRLSSTDRQQFPPEQVSRYLNMLRDAGHLLKRTRDYSRPSPSFAAFLCRLAQSMEPMAVGG